MLRIQLLISFFLVFGHYFGQSYYMLSNQNRNSFQCNPSLMFQDKGHAFYMTYNQTTTLALRDNNFSNRPFHFSSGAKKVFFSKSKTKRKSQFIFPGLGARFNYIQTGGLYSQMNLDLFGGVRFSLNRDNLTSKEKQDSYLSLAAGVQYGTSRAKVPSSDDYYITDLNDPVFIQNVNNRIVNNSYSIGFTYNQYLPNNKTYITFDFVQCSPLKNVVPNIDFYPYQLYRLLYRPNLQNTSVQHLGLSIVKDDNRNYLFPTMAFELIFEELFLNAGLKFHLNTNNDYYDSGLKNPNFFQVLNGAFAGLNWAIKPVDRRYDLKDNTYSRFDFNFEIANNLNSSGAVFQNFSGQLLYSSEKGLSVCDLMILERNEIYSKYDGEERYQAVLDLYNEVKQYPCFDSHKDNDEIVESYKRAKQKLDQIQKLQMNFVSVGNQQWSDKIVSFTEYIEYAASEIEWKEFCKSGIPSYCHKNFSYSDNSVRYYNKYAVEVINDEYDELMELNAHIPTKEEWEEMNQYFSNKEFNPGCYLTRASNKLNHSRRGKHEQCRFNWNQSSFNFLSPGYLIMKNEVLVFERKQSRFWTHSQEYYAVIDLQGNLKVKENTNINRSDEDMDYDYAGYPIRILK